MTRHPIHTARQETPRIIQDHLDTEHARGVVHSLRRLNTQSQAVGNGPLSARRIVAGSLFTSAVLIALPWLIAGAGALVRWVLF